MDIAAYNANPGTSAITQTSETFLHVGREASLEFGNMGLKSTAADSGNTPTTTIRAGKIMAKLDSGGLLTQYAAAGTDGSELAHVVCREAQSVLNAAGTAADTNMHVLLKGWLKASNLLGLDAMTRRQLLYTGRYLFDDDLTGAYMTGGLWIREVAKTADYTVVAGDVGTLFTTTGAAGTVIFTLPTIASGLGPFFFLNVVDQTMTIASAGSNDNIISLHDASADSISFATASEKIGAHVMFVANQAGTKWIYRNFSPGNTITTA